MKIRDLLKRHGLRLDRALGQHFLTDENVLHRIAQATGAGPDAVAVEIGAGLGNLSYMLALSGATVKAIELDRRFEPVHRETVLADPDLAGRLEFLYCDALDFDFGAASREASESGKRLIIAGNIPYQITSPLIMRIFESGAVFDRMVLMMQREVAERLAADPGTKRIGAISIKVQYFSKIDELFDVPSTAFVPPPEVQSRVLSFVPKPAADRHPDDFFRLVDAAFAQRRKMLPNSVASQQIGYSKEQVERALEQIGRTTQTRAEQLGLAEFQKLYRVLQALRADGPR